VLLAGLWVRSELARERREIEEVAQAGAATLAQQVETTLRQQISVLQAIAALPSLDGPDLTAFHSDARRMLEAMPRWQALALVEAETGEQVANTSRPIGSVLPPTAAPDVVREVARTGRVAIHTRPPVQGAVSVSAERMVILYAPVRRDGVIRHVVGAGMRAQTLQEFAEAGAERGRLLTLIVDETGRVLARSQAPERYVGKPVAEALGLKAQARTQGLVSAAGLDGQSAPTAFRHLPVSNWLVVAESDPRAITDLSRRSAGAVAAAGALALTLAGVLGVFLFHSVAQQRLTQERLSASQALGDLDARLLRTTQQALSEQQKAASERDVMLREIFHRVKNNLQIVQSLLRLGGRDLTPEQRGPFESAIRRIGAMSRVHTLLYTSSDLSSIDLGEYLEGLVSELGEAFEAPARGIAVELDAAPLRVNLDAAVPLAFIAVELLTNALTHAFPERSGGTARVTVRQEGNEGVLTVSDDGIGLSPDAPRRLGLTITERLTQQIGGRIERPEPGRSATRIVFPLSSPTPVPVPEPRLVPGALGERPESGA
jgi:two-component sensor histidine kinase/PAS domain-containing protein